MVAYKVHHLLDHLKSIAKMQLANPIAENNGCRGICDDNCNHVSNSFQVSKCKVLSKICYYLKLVLYTMVILVVVIVGKHIL